MTTNHIYAKLSRYNATTSQFHTTTGRVRAAVNWLCVSFNGFSMSLNEDEPATRSFHVSFESINPSFE